MKERCKGVLETIFLKALQAADPEYAVTQHVLRTGDELRVSEQVYRLDRYRKIILLGAGKGTAPMARALEQILEDRLSHGTIIVKYGHTVPLKKTVVIEAGHPIPDRPGLSGAQEILRQLRECTAQDLVICAFSGGGSALLPAPRPPVDLAEKQEVTQLLLKCGATIDEMNAVRKHLSLSKGGGLARMAHPATVISLFLSDVVDDRLDVIASGPTVPDPSTYRECLTICRRCGVWEALPASVKELFAKGTAGRLPETAKCDDPVFARVQNLIVGNNRSALLAGRDQAIALGYNCLVLSSRIQGEAREVARLVASVAKEIRVSGDPVSPPACILAGGETTVTVRGEGHGGRNQELALAAALAIDGWDRISLLSAGTDGTDGSTDAAGAMVDGTTCAEARLLGLDPHDYLLRNDSYGFFTRAGGLLKTGPTRTNVMDIICLIID